MFNVEAFTVTKRPCFVGDRKGMFHMWINEAYVCDGSMVIGGHPGGQVWSILGLVEFEDGHVEKIDPKNIRFADGGEFNETCFRG